MKNWYKYLIVFFVMLLIAVIILWIALTHPELNGPAAGMLRLIYIPYMTIMGIVLVAAIVSFCRRNRRR